MNIKFLKFIVILMGVLIILGIAILGATIYIKLNKFSDTERTDKLIIKIPENLDFIDYEIFEDKIRLSFKSRDKTLIKIYNLKTGKIIKEIEILK